MGSYWDWRELDLHLRKIEITKKKVGKEERGRGWDKETSGQ